VTVFDSIAESDSWQLAPIHESKQSSCRENHAYALKALVHEYASVDNVEWTGAHATGAYTTGFCNPSYYGGGKVFVEVDPCGSTDRCLRVQYTRELTIIPRAGKTRNRVTMAWCCALDPDSYGLTNDMASYSILWCYQEGCRNYYRYLRKAAVAIDEIHRSCSSSCPQ
jgi:hypothetical protein